MSIFGTTIIGTTATNIFGSIFGSGDDGGAGDGPGDLTFGSNNLAKGATKRYLNPGGDRLAAVTRRVDMPVTRDGTLSNFTVTQGVAGEGSGTMTYEILVNDVGTGISVDFLPTDEGVKSSAGTVAILEKQTVGVTITKTQRIDKSPTNVFARMSFTL